MDGKIKAIALSSVLLLTLSFVIGGIYIVSADPMDDDATVSSYSGFMFGWRIRGRFLNCLDEEQRQELKEALEAMKEEGATCEEIRAYVWEYLDQLGVECQRPQLTDEQIAGLQQLRTEIKELIKQRTEQLGIELPFMGAELGFGYRCGRCPNN